MAKYDRLTPNFIDGNRSLETRVHLPGGSRIDIQGGDKADNRIKIMFGVAPVGLGWWVDPDSLGHLIAELLYIRDDLIAVADAGFMPNAAADIELDIEMEADEPDI